MFVEVDPGDGKPLPEDGRIQISNTLPDIDPDEFLSALDTDTRDYLKLLISGAGKGLDGIAARTCARSSSASGRCTATSRASSRGGGGAPPATCAGS